VAINLASIGDTLDSLTTAAAAAALPTKHPPANRRFNQVDGPETANNGRCLCFMAASMYPLWLPTSVNVEFDAKHSGYCRPASIVQVQSRRKIQTMALNVT